MTKLILTKFNHILIELIPNFTKQFLFSGTKPKVTPNHLQKQAINKKFPSILHSLSYAMRKFSSSSSLPCMLTRKKNVIYVLDIKSHSHLSLVSDTIHASVCLCKFLSYMQACMFITLLLPSSSCSVCASSREIKKIYIQRHKQPSLLL